MSRFDDDLPQDRGPAVRDRSGLLVAATLGALAPAVVLLGAPVAVRAPLVAAFLLIGPGLVAIRPTGLRGGDAAVLVPALSLAALALVSLVIVYLGVWSTALVVSLLGAATLVGAVLLVRLRPDELVGVTS